MMVRNLIVKGFCLLLGLTLAGCATSPPSSMPDSEPAVEKVQNPELAQVHAARAQTALDQGNKEDAVDAYRQAVELDHNDAVSANNLALLLREQGQFREAVKLLRQGLQYSPDTADLHYNLAVIAELYLLDLELALTHYRRFSTLNQQEHQLVAGWIADLERRLE
jgi:tetratricopeptide (TPR) repeat protein